VVVSRDVIFEEGRAFRRSLKSRDNIEEVSETHIDVSGSTASGVKYTSFRGDRVTLHSFRITIVEGS
jgi:hypothetical protein